ncbi:hypothetical protein SNEBB_009147 [Seison nebaliae]|nr:hypothetical protein SNEBB_009147 [Seison nebaliae]
MQNHVAKFVTRKTLSSQLMFSRCSSTINDFLLERTRHKQMKYENVEKLSLRRTELFRQRFPDFQPNPIYYLRDSILERVERNDMLKRRKVLKIPEFYAGTILRVTYEDEQFTGICIKRADSGLRHYFILRNFIEDYGVEKFYYLYDPKITSIQLLRFEKRLDDDLTYLRDALPEYSTIPLDMKEDIRLTSSSFDVDNVPMNKTKVKMKEFNSWTQNWLNKRVQGINWNSVDVPEFKLRKAKRNVHDREEWKENDIMLHHRQTISDDDIDRIYWQWKKEENRRLEEENKRDDVKDEGKLGKSTNLLKKRRKRAQ